MRILLIVAALLAANYILMAVLAPKAGRLS